MNIFRAGRISPGRFREASGATPIDVQFGARSRPYYLVACLDDPPGKIVEATSHFVALCDRVRNEVYPNLRGIEDATGADWSNTELAAAVAIYLELLRLEGSGQRPNKTEFRERALKNALRNRSVTSYENRMQNISAVLREDGSAWIAGYKPLPNYGRAGPVIRKLLGAYSEGVLRATSDQADLSLRSLAIRGRMAAGLHSEEPRGNPTPKPRSVMATAFVRDPSVVAWVLQRSNGRCEACAEDAPFQGGDGAPYLEVHHVRPLAEGGPDTIDNTAALCPNCHRRLHSSKDREAYRQKLLSAVGALVDYKVTRVRGSSG